MTTLVLRDVMGMRLDLKMRIGWRTAERRAAHHRQVGPVITHRGGLTPVETQSLKRDFRCGPFVFSTEVGMRDAQSVKPRTQWWAVATRDDRRSDARFLQKLQAVPIQRAEALDGFTFPRQVNTAVRQHAINVEKCHFHPLRKQQQFRRKT